METSLAGARPAYYPMLLCRHGATKPTPGPESMLDVSVGLLGLVCVTALYRLGTPDWCIGLKSLILRARGIDHPCQQ